MPPPRRRSAAAVGSRVPLRAPIFDVLAPAVTAARRRRAGRGGALARGSPGHRVQLRRGPDRRVVEPTSPWPLLRSDPRSTGGNKDSSRLPTLPWLPGHPGHGSGRDTGDRGLASRPSAARTARLPCAVFYNDYTFGECFAGAALVAGGFEGFRLDQLAALCLTPDEPEEGRRSLRAGASDTAQRGAW